MLHAAGPEQKKARFPHLVKPPVGSGSVSCGVSCDSEAVYKFSDLLTYLRSVWVWLGGDVCKLQRGGVVTSVLSLAVEVDRCRP